MTCHRNPFYDRRAQELVTADITRQQLEKILASDIFVHSERLSRFLRFAVERAMEGKGAELKEYAVAVEVFDREKDFDPRIDPIVRVQASKLRAKLLEYYSAEGVHDPCVIVIPKGAYVPEFQMKAAPATQAAQAPVPAAAGDSSIAVLPFVNFSSDPENEYFSDGLTEELINAFATVPGLRVVARTSAFFFKGKNEDIRAIGSKLSVRNVLEGSVRKSGNQLRITAQLINVADGYHLWSHTYQREVRDVFAIQEEIATTVTTALVPHLGMSPPPKPVIKGQTKNLEAYNLYLKGRYLQSRQFGTTLSDIVALFEEAIALEPGYAPAHAGLADTYTMQSWTSMMPSHQIMPLARAAAEKALALDDRLAAAHVSLALVECNYEWNFSSGERRFLRAIELDPGYALAYHMYAFHLLIPQRRFEDALSEIERARALDPLNPWFEIGMIYMLGALARYDEAFELQRLMLRIHPGFFGAHMHGYLIHDRKGECREALPHVELACKLSQRKPVMLGFLGHAYARAGKVTQARAILRELEKAALTMHVSALDFAIVHAGLQDRRQTLDWLNKALDERVGRVLIVGADHRFDWLRSDAEFQALLQRVGLSERKRGQAG